MEINLSYSEFKNRTLGKLFWQYVESDNRYDIYAYDGNEKISTNLLKDPEHTFGMLPEEIAQARADLNEFESAYKSSCNRPNVVSPIAAQSQFHGRTIEMSAEDTIGYCEWSFDKDVYISKVMPIPIDAQKGDTLNLEVWTKPGVMGPNPVKVGQYGFDIPIRDTGGIGWIYGSGGGEIKSYCTVRCYYHKSAGTPRDFNIIGEFLV